ncbi:hypothetical protein IFR05_001662 [Cadophora sp. M221]|nr:hypothetical protein IFR05_001662 [Cadophora sp. M221]
MPRIYVLLRLIGQVEIANVFIDEEITDLGFPFTQRTLPHAFTDQTARHNFLKTQPLVCSTLLELAWGIEHHHFARESNIPLSILSDLGSGGYGSVDRFVGSYTDPKFVGILMSPVAECNFKQYLEGSFDKSRVRSFFGCLATAVRYLHENKVRHKDIKPQNVLVHRGTVLLTDFGISRNWTAAGHSTTAGITPKTARYCAPEVDEEAPRNSSSDIWSLGCVFLEMWSVVSGHSLEALTMYLEDTESHYSAYHLNLKGIEQRCALKWPGDPGTSGPLHWIRNMLHMNQKQRWIIQKLYDCIQEQSEESQLSFVGLCCDSSVDCLESTTDPVEETTTPQILRGPSEDGLSSTNISLISSLGLGQIHLGTDSASMGAVSHAQGTESEHPPTFMRNPTKKPPVARHASGRRGNPGSSRPKRVKIRSEGALHDTGPERERHSEREDPYSLRSSEASEGQIKPPNSFVLAQAHRFTSGDVMKLLPASQNSTSTQSRPTRLTKGFEEIFLSYGDCMLPNVVYAETCVRSKPSQYSRWSTRKGLIQHMTPGVIHGYSRLCLDAREGMSSLPTIMPTGLGTDTVEGMLIFGFHDSHARGRRSVLGQFPNPTNQQVLPTIPTLQSLGFKVNAGNMTLTKNSISILFHKQARYFILKEKSEEAIQTFLDHGIWSSTPTVNAKLDQAFQKYTSRPIIVFLVHPSQGFLGLARVVSPVDRSGTGHAWVTAKLRAERFSVDGVQRARIPLSEFSHIRVQHNHEGQNSSRCVASCQDGTEVSSYAGVDIMKIFEQSNDSTDQSSGQLTTLEDR